MTVKDVVVIGAGPFGLSTSAHLGARGVDHVLVGGPMSTWRDNMPEGMKLRSEPYGSDLAAPERGWDVRGHCKARGLEYVHRLGPLPVEQLLDYTDWYTERWVPEHLDDTVTSLEPVDGGFRVSFAGADGVTARQVVVAAGLLPFRVLPEELSALPADLVTHTSDHNRLSDYAGRRVAVVGGGQSALETAALLHEAGADVTLLTRRPALNWLDPNPAEVSLPGHLRRPVNKLCEGWRCQFYYTPAAFRRLPARIRLEKARSVLGPAGAWWLKDRVDGVVDVRTGTRVAGATATGTGVRLDLAGTHAGEFEVEHVMCGTGFRVDVERLDFISRPLRSSLEQVDGYPVLSRSGRSSVDGLFFAGAAAAFSLGPSTRFIAGTHTTIPSLARALARSAGAGVSAELATVREQAA